MTEPGDGSAGPCPLCGGAATPATLRESGWLPPAARKKLLDDHPEWRREDGACPACVQDALLRTLLRRGDAALHEGIQGAWPLDAAAAFGALPTPLRMHADPRYAGRGVTIALVDAAFHPHPDLTEPANRIRAWVDASGDPPRALRFERDGRPRWPGSDAAAPPQWHGLMTSAVAAGSGRLSHGLYRGIAAEADLVLIQVRQEDGRITSAGIARALRWLLEHGPGLGVRVASLSVGGDAGPLRPDDPVDAAIAALVRAGIVVFAAAGNDGHRSLVPPATAPEALTVGGLDDKNSFDHAAMELWHGNYGETAGGAGKPDLVAPSLWVVAPILPGTSAAGEAARLFERRAAADPEVEERLAGRKLITPHYHHVDGTSVAAPLAAGVAACMLQANPALTPSVLRRAMLRACRPVPGAAAERQGAGALDAGQAVALALREQHGPLAFRVLSPVVMPRQIAFVLHDHDARVVRVHGSWDGWRGGGLPARLVEPGIWQADLPRPARGRYEYKFLLDGQRWMDDPDNPVKAPDGYGRLNSVVAF